MSIPGWPPGCRQTPAIEPGTRQPIAQVLRYSVPLSGVTSAPLPFLCIGSSPGGELVADPVVAGRRGGMGPGAARSRPGDQVVPVDRPTPSQPAADRRPGERPPEA